MAKTKKKPEGRKKGVPNLVKVDGGYKNQYGVTFTEKEKRALESAVNSANRKRKKMLAEEAALPRMLKGEQLNVEHGQLQLMGKESDFIIAKRTKSLQRFKDKEQYEKYMRNLERVNSKDYIGERTKLYKRNHMKAIENVFGDEGKDVMMKIRMMNPDKYRKMVQADEFLEINYVYDPSERTGKLNQIRASLGMKLKEG